MSGFLNVILAFLAGAILMFAFACWTVYTKLGGSFLRMLFKRKSKVSPNLAGGPTPPDP